MERKILVILLKLSDFTVGEYQCVRKCVHAFAGQELLETGS